MQGGFVVALRGGRLLCVQSHVEGCWATQGLREEMMGKKKTR